MGERDAIQPFDRLESVSFRHDHPHRPAALRGQRSPIELVAYDDLRQTKRILEHPADWQRTAEHLLGIVVVITVIIDAANSLLWLREPDDLAQRYPLPDAH